MPFTRLIPKEKKTRITFLNIPNLLTVKIMQNKCNKKIQPTDFYQLYKT